MKVLLWTLGTLLALAAVVPAAPGKLEYNRDVRPILADNCFACHGPDSAARKADLRLDQRDMAMDGGAIVPGKPDQSPLVERIYSADKSEVMPPHKTNKKLTDAQKAVLKQWVAEGADYQPHWSFIPPTRTPLPTVKNERWVKNPVDRFILARLEAAGLTPAPEADRRTLARRLALDLTGLPPDPKDVEEVVGDKSAEWYEKYVDKLMRSSAWGEHRGRYWLDAARYADTHGIHFDNYREVWAFREWVIRAFNQNKPFDQFTVEQLAGDLLPNPSKLQLLATGFNRNHMINFEGGAIPEEYHNAYIVDRVNTTSTVWMGLTMGCAQCHDHKYDPISQKDFYRLYAFFNNVPEKGLDGNKGNAMPFIKVPDPDQQKRLAALRSEL